MKLFRIEPRENGTMYPYSAIFELTVDEYREEMHNICRKCLLTRHPTTDDSGFHAGTPYMEDIKVDANLTLIGAIAIRVFEERYPNRDKYLKEYHFKDALYNKDTIEQEN